MRSYLVGTRVYDTLKDAANANGFSRKGLGSALACGRSFYKGLRIDYVEDWHDFDEPRTSCPSLDAWLERQERTHHGGLLGRTEVAR